MATRTIRVNDHVTVFDAMGKARPGTVTANNAGALDVRVGHNGETYTAIPEWFAPAATTPRGDNYVKH